MRERELESEGERATVRERERQRETERERGPQTTVACNLPLANPPIHTCLSWHRTGGREQGSDVIHSGE